MGERRSFGDGKQTGYEQCTLCPDHHRQTPAQSAEEPGLVHSGHICSDWGWTVRGTGLAIRDHHEEEEVIVTPGRALLIFMRIFVCWHSVKEAEHEIDFLFCLLYLWVSVVCNAVMMFLFNSYDQRLAFLCRK